MSGFITASGKAKTDKDKKSKMTW